MSKTILFCADGTWNGPCDDDDNDGVPDVTNVLKIFLALRGDDTQHGWNKNNEQERELYDGEGNLVQIAKYMHGVGDSTNGLVRAIGGLFGAGVIARIVRGYTFISRNYVPGDKIVLTGFSRGAYTARALGGLIASQGLLNRATVDPDDKERSYRMGTAAWHKYRRVSITDKEPGLLGMFERMVDDLPRFASQDLDPADLLPVPQIYAIAVWDTVGAMGIPKYDFHDERIDTFRFADTKLSAKVTHAFHAISIDEQRADFSPTLWSDDARIKQVLFPGAHADVGGGYPTKGNQSGLSDVALDWMMKELKAIGVRFGDKQPIPVAPDPSADEHRPWESGIFKSFPPQLRALPDGLQLHASVLMRMAAKGYSPSNLKDYFDKDGKPRPGVRIVDDD